MMLKDVWLTTSYIYQILQYIKKNYGLMLIEFQNQLIEKNIKATVICVFTCTFVF